MTAAAGTGRLPVIDALKVIASQLIVLHHLAFYGPMSDHAAELMPALFDWFSQHARLAVQVFLVVGGFLAGQRLLPAASAWASGQLLLRLLERYLRLMLPLVFALLLAIAAAQIARGWMVHDSVPDAPQLTQLLAHLLLAQDLVGEDALSAGVWYVAIAFQLHAGLLLLLALPAALGAGLRGRFGASSLDPGRLLPWLMALFVVASAFHFNRDPAWDVAAPYFFAAYGLGVLLAWRSVGTGAGFAWWSAVALVAVALLVEWRDRLGLALLLAGGLWFWQARLATASGGRDAQRAASAGRTRFERLTSRLALSSYALFLVHFPVLLLVNAAFTRFVATDPWLQVIGVLLAWACSVIAGEYFFRWIERPLMQRIDRGWRGAAKAQTRAA
ncbi:acyltransferase family protein [Piscinibacter sakaiensis]|uniref:acyltransferase family protein n=1 Tax=Piscinibacter sakaiensis TaxID=1547922 RepID=UPI003AAB3895